jgi:hypothetical protein
MGNKKKARQKQEPAPPKARAWGRRDGLILAAIAGGGLLIGGAIWVATNPPPPPTPPPVAPDSPADDSTGSQSPSDVPAAPADFQQLIGQWVRSDGGYVIDVKSVDANGKLDAAYLNPNPINVAQAEASLDGAAINVFVELRDVNYPGSTYDLTLNAAANQLRGIYFQAAQQQQFDVTFDRAN